MFTLAQERTNYWSRIRKKAPKVPDITCPAIDDVLKQLEKCINKELHKRKYKAFERKLEKLRKENERLRDCDIYWHDACKEAVRDLIGKKKTR